MLRRLTRCVPGASISSSSLPPVRCREGARFEGPQMHSAGRTDHLHTPDNTRSTPFEFNDANWDRIKWWLSHYPGKRQSSGVIPLLHIAQEQCGGWVPLAAMDKIAKICGVPAMQVYEVASFYSQFNRQPIGKFLVQVCDTTPCMLMGSDEIEKALEKHLGIHMGDTTPCGMVTLGEFECLGSCSNAPMFWVTDYSNPQDPSKFTSQYYEDLTPETAVAIVDQLLKGVKPPVRCVILDQIVGFRLLLHPFVCFSTSLSSLFLFLPPAALPTFPCPPPLLHLSPSLILLLSYCASPYPSLPLPFSSFRTSAWASEWTNSCCPIGWSYYTQRPAAGSVLP